MKGKHKALEQLARQIEILDNEMHSSFGPVMIYCAGTKLHSPEFELVVAEAKAMHNTGVGFAMCETPGEAALFWCFCYHMIELNEPR